MRIERKLLNVKSKILSNFFNEKYGLKLGEFNSTTGTERVKPYRNVRSIAFILFEIPMSFLAL